jgi:hypothetical protein
MEGRIKAQGAQVITGIGLVIQFVVEDGAIRPGMKIKFEGKTFQIGDRMYAYENQTYAKNALRFSGMADPAPQKFRELKEARKEDNIIQANVVCEMDPYEARVHLMKNASGVFSFSDPK